MKNQGSDIERNKLIEDGKIIGFDEIIKQMKELITICKIYMYMYFFF